MNDPAKSAYHSNTREKEEVWVLFDCRGRGAKNRFHRERRAWGANACYESLGNGRVVLVVRPGGATELEA